MPRPRWYNASNSLFFRQKVANDLISRSLFAINLQWESGWRDARKVGRAVAFGPGFDGAQRHPARFAMAVADQGQTAELEPQRPGRDVACRDKQDQHQTGQQVLLRSPCKSDMWRI